MGVIIFSFERIVPIYLLCLRNTPKTALSSMTSCHSQIFLPKWVALAPLAQCCMKQRCFRDESFAELLDFLMHIYTILHSNETMKPGNGEKHFYSSRLYLIENLISERCHMLLEGVIRYLDIKGGLLQMSSPKPGKIKLHTFDR